MEIEKKNDGGKRDGPPEGSVKELVDRSWGTLTVYTWDGEREMGKKKRLGRTSADEHRSGRTCFCNRTPLRTEEKALGQTVDN